MLSQGLPAFFPCPRRATSGPHVKPRPACILPCPQTRYIRSSREIKRLDSLALSPIFGHFGETLAVGFVFMGFVTRLFVGSVMMRLDSLALSPIFGHFGETLAVSRTGLWATCLQAIAVPCRLGITLARRWR